MQRELKKQRVAVFSEQMLQGDHGEVFEPLYQDSQTDGTMYTDNHKAFYINILMKRTHTNLKIQGVMRGLLNMNIKILPTFEKSKMIAIAKRMRPMIFVF